MNRIIFFLDGNFETLNLKRNFKNINKVKPKLTVKILNHFLKQSVSNYVNNNSKIMITQSISIPKLYNSEVDSLEQFRTTEKKIINKFQNLRSNDFVYGLKLNILNIAWLISNVRIYSYLHS